MEIILGPPGTGKTTKLIELVADELKRGTDPARIGYVSFTRRAANEAAHRATEALGLPPSDLPYFRTLHSLCFRALGLRSEDVFQGARLREFGEWAGVKVTGQMSKDGLLTGLEMGDRIMFMITLAQVQMRDLREVYNEYDDGLAWSRVEYLAKCMREYKTAKGLMDYNDMLAEFPRRGRIPALDVLVVDEAQDLSMLQWEVVRMLARGVRRVVVAGDDDQAIFRWAGAAVDFFIALEGNARVLDQSWRVPPAIQKIAATLTPRMGPRRVKIWRARKGGAGDTDRAEEFAAVDLSEDRDVLVLCRNNYLIREVVVPELRRRGVWYEIDGNPAVSATVMDAIRDWEALRAGRAVSAEAARRIYLHMSSGKSVARGHKTLPMIGDDEEAITLADLRDRGGLLTDAIWYEALDRIPPPDAGYLIEARRRGEKLNQRPRVRVSTVHGAKGGQADRVVLLTDMARRTHAEMDARPEDEARVWYVGVTRARERLTIVEPHGRWSCPWL